jgi:hypothetical protein
MGFARSFRRQMLKRKNVVAKKRRKVLFEPLEPRLLLDANPVLGSLDVPGETDRYTFSLTADQRLLFDALEGDTGVHWSLDGPRGAEVTDRAFDATGYWANPALDLVPGDYTITVDGSGDTTGSYAFQIHDLASAAILPLGTPITETLDPGNGAALYQFAAQAGDRIYFDSQDYTGSVYYTLLDSFAQPVFADVFSGNDLDVQTLTVTGTYTLLVDGYFYQTDPATVTFSLQPVTDDSASLPLGTPVTGDIAHTGQQDHYDFSLSAPAVLYFDFLASDNASLNVTLAGPRGIEMSGDLYSFSYEPMPVEVVSGDYTLTVDGWQDATGDYSFRLLDVAAAATPLPLDTQVSGTLDPGSEVDLYQFSASAGDQLLFDSQGLTGGTNTYWSLVDPFGRTVFENNYAGSDTGPWTLPASGTYTLLVAGYNPAGTPGGYAFIVQDQGDTPPPPITGTAVTLNTTVQGTLDVAGEVDAYVFTLAAPTRLVFDSLTNDANLTWSLRGPRGEEVSNLSFAFYDNAMADLIAGDYQLSIQGTGAVPAPYVFRLLDVAAATAITPGTPVSGTLTPANATNLYQFTAAAGDQIYFDAQISSGGSLEAHRSLRDRAVLPELVRCRDPDPDRSRHIQSAGGRLHFKHRRQRRFYIQPSAGPKRHNGSDRWCAHRRRHFPRRAAGQLQLHAC